jgi:group II intron reverse transcriptase/maturase
LDALYVAIFTKRIGWVLDADIKAYFDTIDHGWLRTFLEHRIGDKHVIYLILKWLKAGVLDEGLVKDSEVGAPQGSCISPLLSNIFLHYVYDLWVNQWRKSASGDIIAVRYADDSVVGFQYKETAEKFLHALEARMEKFKLRLHPDKTRLIEFGRFAAISRSKRGAPKPETFDFLGFTHICGKTLGGKFTILRQPNRKRTQEKLKAIYQKLKEKMHQPIPAVGIWLGQIVHGYNRYFGVPMASPQTGYFRFRVLWLWHRVIRRRSQRSRMTWTRMMRLAAKYIPPVRVVHPYPLERFGVKI